jgi:hypothetical protein
VVDNNAATTSTVARVAMAQVRDARARFGRASALLARTSVTRDQCCDLKIYFCWNFFCEKRRFIKKYCYYTYAKSWLSRKLHIFAENRQK